MIVLFGAGNCGRSIARDLKELFVFTDNNPSTWGTMMLGVPVLSPAYALAQYPDAKWVAAIGKPERHAVIEQMKGMGLTPEQPWGYLSMMMGLPPDGARRTIEDEYSSFIGDEKTLAEWFDQRKFRYSQNYDAQRPCDDMLDIYFPEFILKRDDEHFVDCGAADGDTVQEFIKRWEKWSHITAFEPDGRNYALLSMSVSESDCQIINDGNCDLVASAISDHEGETMFVSTGDYSAHIGDGDRKVHVGKLDDFAFHVSPTFIKMDIEGSELEALWGARRILKEHSPVLAICAYHTSDHLWQIPLLIHAIQPDYKLFLRRYSPGTMDLVWYAVSPERIRV